MRVHKTPRFEKLYKKLRPNQREAVDEAIDLVLNNPAIGKPKTGDLSGIIIYKFSMVNQQALLGYSYLDDETLLLQAVGPHENFYRDLKKH